jgi:predicted Rossmann fold flavoprotein
MSFRETADVVVVGAGAAGLMAAISCARHHPGARVVCLDGARSIGAKILISGGGRCNVTNRIVTERDFWGGPHRVVRDVLRAFPAVRAVEFFSELGVTLHDEPDGKLFPATNRARTVLDALLAEITQRDVRLRTGQRVTGVRGTNAGFDIDVAQGTWSARKVVLATGGRSLPKSGSDGFGYQIASQLGHGHVPTTPALVPLLFDDERLHALSGVAHPATLAVRSDGRQPTRLTGALLWTHFGASGPVVLNASRHWARSVLEGVGATVHVTVVPSATFETLERWLLEEAVVRPRADVATVLSSRLPLSVAGTWVRLAGVPLDTTLAHLSRDDRRALVRALLDTRLEVRDTRGYRYAEVTAGGVPLTQIDPRTMQSLVCPGLFLVGEILDVDGRIGGFNFQWAWSSGWVAGKAVASGL